MKKPILLFAVLVFFVTKNNAQTEWAPVGAKWVNEAVRLEQGLYFLISFESVKDTMVLGKNCKKILKIVLCHSNGIVKPCNPEKELSVFFIYSENDKVYYSNGDSFILMYDFSLKTGDTVSVYQQSKYYEDTFTLNCYTVIKTDSIQINGKILKRQSVLPIDSFDPNDKYKFYHYAGYIIERIGNEFSLFGTFIDATESWGPPYLKCYSDSEISYQNPKYHNCYGLEGVAENFKIDPIQLYPNPATDNINIISSIRQNLTMQVYNAVGQCVMQIELNNLTNNIDISSLTKGIYILKFMNPMGTLEKKLIKE